MDNKLMLEWVKEVNKEFTETRTHFDEAIQKMAQANQDQHKEIMDEVARNREEFVIHKTKVNVRVTVISSVIGFFVLITSLALNADKIKDRVDAKKAMQNTEITK